MQRQSFVFNPTQLNVNSSQYSKQYEESMKDFGPTGGLRNYRQQVQHAKVTEPLLLPCTTKPRQYSDGQKEMMADRAGEKITTLHSKLHQEAEKVKQWKINTEIKLKEKERKIIEANKTVESLRKSILELQFLNENLNSKLQEDRTTQEEATQKIGVTRNMCSALKEHLVKLESSVFAGEKMLDVQKCENNQRVEKYKELILKFQELEIKVNSREHEMKKHVERIENDHEYEKEGLIKKIKEGEETTNSLQELNESYKQNMEELNKRLSQIDQEVQHFKSECSSLQAKLEEAGRKYYEQESILNEEKCEKNTLMNEAQSLKVEYEIKVSEMTSEFEKLSREMSEKQDRIDIQGCELAKKQQEVTELQETIQQKTELLEQVQQNYNEFYSLNNELKTSANNLKDELKVITLEMEEKEIQLKSKREEKEGLERMLLEERQKVDQLNDVFNRSRSEVEGLKEREVYLVQLEAKENELKAEIVELRNEIKERTNVIESEAGKMIAAEQNNQSLIAENKHMGQVVEELKSAKEMIERELQEKTMLLEEHYSELEKSKDDISVLEKTITELRDEQGYNADAHQQEVVSRDKRLENAENRVKSMQTKLDNKAKLVSKFQAETKSLKTQLKVQQKSMKKLENEMEETKGELEGYKNKMKEVLDNADMQLKASLVDINRFKADSEILRNEREVLIKDLQSLDEQMKSSKQQSHEAERQLREEKQNFDAQIAEMCKTLEKYKMDNEKLMNAKEKEFDKQTKDLVQSKSSFEETLKEKQLEIDDYKKSIEEKEKKIKELSENYEKIQSFMKNYNVSEHESTTSNKDTSDEDMRLFKSTDLFVTPREEKKQVAKKPFYPSPKPNQVVSPRVPKTPKTPPTLNSTLTAPARTPQGILRMSDEKPARSKHVAFSDLTDGSDNEEDVLMKTKKSPKLVYRGNKPTSNVNSVRPIVKASPTLSLSAEKAKQATAAVIQSPGKRLKRDLPRQAVKPTEKEKFNKLFPNYEDKKKEAIARSPGIMAKKSPFKSKVKKIVPRASTKKKEESLSWFESDAAFSFGIEE
eukprot:gene14294-15781_t